METRAGYRSSYDGWKLRLSQDDEKQEDEMQKNERPQRPWREIATELSCETDGTRILELSRELRQALDQQQLHVPCPAPQSPQPPPQSAQPGPKQGDR